MVRSTSFEVINLSACYGIISVGRVFQAGKFPSAGNASRMNCSLTESEIIVATGAEKGGEGRGALKGGANSGGQLASLS